MLRGAGRLFMLAYFWFATGAAIGAVRQQEWGMAAFCGFWSAWGAFWLWGYGRPLPWSLKRTGLRYFHRREKVKWFLACRKCGCPVTDKKDDILDSYDGEIVRHRCGKVRR